MDPNQTNPPTDGSAPIDPNAPAQNPAPQLDPAQQQPVTPTPTDGSVPASPVGTDTTTGTYAPSSLNSATILGMPVDALMVGGPIFLAGLLMFAYLSGRSGHTEQLTRLDKQRKRLEAKEAARPEAVDIFKVERDDYLGKLLATAGLEAQYKKYQQYWLMTVVGTTIVIAIGSLYGDAKALAPFSFILGPGLGSFGFVQFVKFKAHERQKKLTQQLPQVLESMVSTLKAGSPVVECFKLLAETAPLPIRDEFRRGLVSMQLGKSFRDVLAEMGTRIRTADFKLLMQAIFISQDVGANLADVVATIAEAIRERFRLRDFLAALTAQGKMTALFIGALPYFITAMTYLITPGYITPFLNHPIARIVFICMMIWEAIGAYILVKMTTFEV